MISSLAQVHSLKVIGRSSSFRFRGKDQDDTAAIGAKLGVATLVQGTVLFVATAYVLINVLVDITYAFADPRIRFG